MDTERGLSGLERGSKLQTHGNGGALALPVATFNEKRFRDFSTSYRSFGSRTTLIPLSATQKHMGIKLTVGSRAWVYRHPSTQQQMTLESRVMGRNL